MVTSESKTRRRYGKSEWTKRELSRRKVWLHAWTLDEDGQSLSGDGTFWKSRSVEKATSKRWLQLFGRRQRTEELEEAGYRSPTSFIHRKNLQEETKVVCACLLNFVWFCATRIERVWIFFPPSWHSTTLTTIHELMSTFLFSRALSANFWVSSQSVCSKKGKRIKEGMVQDFFLVFCVSTLRLHSTQHGSKPLYTEQNFRDFSLAKVFFWTKNFKSENFMHIKWSEEKFLKGIVDLQIKLWFWNKLQMTHFLLMQLASYKNLLTKKSKYQLYVLIDFICLQNFLVWFFDTLILFHEFYCSATAVWTKVLSICVCFKIAASFTYPQYLLTTSPRSITPAWNSRIWHFQLNSTLLPRRNVWNLVFATSRPESMKLTCQFRRSRTLRPC